MTAWDIYWWVKLDDIASTGWLFVILLLVAILIHAIAGSILCFLDKKIPKQVYYLIWSGLLVFTITFSGLVTFIPSTKQMAVIYLTPKIINSEATQELTTIPKDAAVMMRKLMDDWMAEYMPEKVMNQVGGGEGSKE